MSSEKTVARLPYIPPRFEKHAKAIRKTARSTLELELTPATDMKLWQSKVGGEPYLPLTEKYPCTDEGRPLMLLAQINFAEMPHLPKHPEKGILQFYIDAKDENLHMGCNFDDPLDRGKFRVLFFEEVHEDDSKLHRGLAKYQDRETDGMDSPLQNNANYSINFSTHSQYITPLDYRFEQMPFAEDDELVDAYTAFFPPGGHRIGGYAYFTQTDFRKRIPELQGYELLFQLDSEYSNDDDGIRIMWGDMGVGGFFIRPEDLQKGDFSRVAYNWDCS